MRAVQAVGVVVLLLFAGCYRRASSEQAATREPLTLRPQTAVESQTIRGIVLSDRQRGRIVSASVELSDLQLRAVVEEDGRFTLYPVSKGRHQLRVRSQGYEPLDRPVEMPGTNGAAIAVLLARPIYCLDQCARAVTHPPSRVENVR